jgi:aminoglycoside phosphotransferase (APT) family kinase protein
MHNNEFHIDDALVRGLIDSQFPRWKELPLSPIRSSGTVHAIYRLGGHLAVRIPRAAEFTPALEREAAILPTLGRLLPIDIPELVAVGAPSGSYPSTWSVLKWIDGESMATTPVNDLVAVANRLGAFVSSMRAIDLRGESSTNQRGQPLASNDEWTRNSIDSVADEFDPAVLKALWETALAAPRWDGSKTWIHGDLLPGNLLVVNDELTAVIDFGECAVGNPTCDLIAGWWVFQGASRQAFRRASGADTDSWDRARGWALSGAVGALSYYAVTNPDFADQARHTLRNVIDDT